MRGRAFKFVVGAAIIAFPSAAILGGEEPCPSAEACLARSLDRAWEQYYWAIDRTWDEKKKVAELRRNRAPNTSGLTLYLPADTAVVQWRGGRAA